MRTFALLPLLLIAVGCSEQPSTTPQASVPAVEVTEAVFNAEGAPTVAFEVPGLHCEMCAKGVCGALEASPGVVDVQVDLESKQATVAVNEEAFDADLALEALAEAHFKKASLVAADASTEDAGDLPQQE